MATNFPRAVDTLASIAANPPMNSAARNSIAIVDDIQDALRAVQTYLKADQRWQFTDLETTTASQLIPFGASTALNGGSNTSAIPTTDYPSFGTINGMNYIRSGASTPSGFRYAPVASYRGVQGLCCRFIFRPRTSMATTGFTIGLHNAVSANVEPTNGCYLWVTAGGVAVFKTAKGGVRSSAPAVPGGLAVNTWYAVDVWYINNTTVRCVITNAQTGVQLYLVDLATNVPNTTSELIQPSWLGWNSSASSDIALVDLCGFGPIVPAFMDR
ncbi:hypothetical protein [Microcystis phage Me-ZS1]|nr:hypothetical protein [Microcystis phage Me-ZS1]